MTTSMAMVVIKLARHSGDAKNGIKSEHRAMTTRKTRKMAIC
jgi:hypothetical protein